MSTTPPGWYPDPSGQHGTRWWDGTGWTSHVGPANAQAQRPRIPDHVSTDTVFVWVMVLLPLIALPISVFSHPEFRYVVVEPGVRTVDPASISTPAYILLQVFTLLMYAADVVLAFCDHRALRRRGVVRPFPWPWAFLLSPILYVIGRSVVLRKVAPGRPMWPLWVAIAVTAVGLVVGIVRAVTTFQQMLP